MNTPTSVENLFRHEAGKLTAALTKVFGTHHLQMVEDVVQDSLLKALEQWKFKGMPENPSAWLFTVARNKALDVVRKTKHQQSFSKEISRLLTSEYSAATTLTELLTPAHIEDEQLRMMFVCCHPSVPEEGQVSLILKTLCGFSTAEISHAFLTNEETITKRLYRAKEQFRQQAIAFEMPAPHELQSRLENVLTAIYLIFNEGYHASHELSIVREDLVEESLRLGKMLVENPLTQRPIAFALLALLCFNAARVHGRVDELGNLVQLREQDRTKWNASLIEQGNFYLNRASGGNELTQYHLEAAIAYEHCQALTFAETNWQRIVELYDWLYQLKPMPLIQLNQLIALAEWKGAHVALAKLNDLQLMEQLPNNALLHAALGEWTLSIGEKESAKGHFEKAVGLSKTEKEKLFFTNRLLECY